MRSRHTYGMRRTTIYLPDELKAALERTAPETSQRVMRAMLEMRKIDIATLEQAAAA